MGYTDRTADFREASKLKQDFSPPAKRRKSTTEAEPRDTFGKRFLQEAYIIVRPPFRLPMRRLTRPSRS